MVGSHLTLINIFYLRNHFCDLSYHVIGTNDEGYNFLRCIIVNKQQQAKDNTDSKDFVILL